MTPDLSAALDRMRKPLITSGPLLRRDLDRAVAALDRVLAAHRNADGRCAWCRESDGRRATWPCGEYIAIAAELAPAPEAAEGETR